MITFSATTFVVLTLVVVLLLLLAAWAYSTANRLDRLHVRSDKSWQALDSALARRAVVARAVAAAIAEPAPAERAVRLAALSDVAERADRGGRETAENQLSAALSGVDITQLRPQLVAELADAEARVLLARRFHNDAVRDTRALRSRRPVRWLHLGGTAPLPSYFEITERAGPAAATGLSVDTTRISARVVLLDENDRVLLLRCHDPRTPDQPFWITVGGGVEPGESLRAAAVREAHEETGLQLEPSNLHGPVWRRVAVFPYDGQLIRSEELFFIARVPAFEPAPAALEPIEAATLTEHRWCTAAEVTELEHHGEPVYPADLAHLFEEAAAVVSGGDDAEVRSIR